MDKTNWILIDTETTGIKQPIWVVEIAAQRMRGWQPEGPAFRRLLNQNKNISPEASRVHGYTREILERDGGPPLEAYAAFAEYVENHPLVAYNLRYDFDDVLVPEWQRLGVDPISHAGFCALRLAQRLLDPVPAGNCKLQTLRQYYRLPERGAHTALGDVETVADLMDQVLRPIAERRNLRTWNQIVSYTTEAWFPSRIAFGKFKGRQFEEARDDPELYGWLEWLAESGNGRSATMGVWYLQQLTEHDGDEPFSTFVTEPSVANTTDLVFYVDPEVKTLEELIAAARIRFAELEAEYTQEQHEVHVIQAKLFNLLRPQYQKLDRLRLVVQYRRRYLDTLLQSGEDEAEQIGQQYENAREESDREYEDAARVAKDQKDLSTEEKKELKSLWRRLVRLHHPDRFHNDSEKNAASEYLTSEINQARDRGDIQRLREIDDNPNAFLLRHGRCTLDFDDGNELPKLRQLYEALQLQIITTLESLNQLRESDDYALSRLGHEQSDILEEIAAQQAREIEEQILLWEAEAMALGREIEMLTGETREELAL